MKTERNILIAFILNLAFSIFEFVGGIISGSVAIMSDAVHDIGDAASIGVSYFLEKKGEKYSIIGAFITTFTLLIGSIVTICNAIGRLMEPAKINYDGMIVFAIVGVCVNLCAAFVTREGDSLNQKAVNLHMLEDVLGWIVVLVGAVVMRFTDFILLDPIMSIGVSAFILINAIRNLIEIFLHSGDTHGHHGHHHHHHADEVFGSWGRETEVKFSADLLKTMLEQLSDEERFGLVLRAKGIVDGGESWLHFDYVPGEISVREGSPAVTGRLCVIGSKLKEEALALLFGV